MTDHAPVLVLGATGGQGGTVVRALQPAVPAGYGADIAALRRDHPEVGWTPFAAWAHRMFAESFSGGTR